MEDVIVKETLLDDAFKVHIEIDEFKEANDSIELFEDRLNGKKALILVGYYKGLPAGYMMCYDRYNDGSFYCWMAGVKTEFRRHGILKKMMDYLFSWAKEHDYDKIKIKTQNDRREMLSFLVKNGWNFTFVKEKDNVMNNKISLEINL